MVQTPQQWSAQLHEALAQSNQRLLIDCAGDLDWCLEKANALAQNFKAPILSDQNIKTCLEVIPFNKSIQLLGQEFNVIIYDAFSGFDVDTFVRAIGLVQAPGLLVLMRPNNESWLHLDDVKNTWQNKKQGHHFFIQYLINQLVESFAVLPCHQSSNLKPIEPLSESLKTIIKESSLLSEQQQSAWNKLQTFFDKKQSIALLAERGRGKSTLIGQWISQKSLSTKHFIVTSDSKKAAGHCLRFSEDKANVEYKAIDKLLIDKPKADCIIVDEAATIPVALLFELKQHYQHIIYTTTLDGYEGTGQGFDLQFLATFNKQSLVHIELTAPMRWGNNDLLETWMKKVFLFKQEEKTLENNTLSHQQLSYQQLTQQTLSKNTLLFKQIFHLLKTAHYRSKASDIRMLLDNPDITLFVAQSQSQVIGVMVLISEGGFDQELTQEIYFGKRRPQGHLLAQGLTVHGGCEQFAELKGVRIQRIAVAQTYRQQGIGSQLIKMAKEYASQIHVDYLGSVFALDEKRIKFWQSNQLTLMMVSVGQGTSTGKPSLTMLFPISKKVVHYIKQCQEALRINFSERLLTHYKTMPTSQVSSLLSLIPSLGKDNAKACDSFINGFRGFEYVLSDLRLYTFYLLQSNSCSLVKEDKDLLIEAVLQYKTWPELIKTYGLSGKKELNQRIKAVFKKETL